MKFPPFVFALFLALPVAAKAEGLSKENCAATRAIVSDAIAARKAGDSAKTIKARLTTGKKAVPEKYRLTVAPLVEMVFTLTPSSLTEKTADDYEATCLSYKP